MGRPSNPDLTLPWKINMPATLAGKVEYLLWDAIHNKPRYGARNKLIVALLESWLSEQETGAKTPVPTLADLKQPS